MDEEFRFIMKLQEITMKELWDNEEDEIWNEYAEDINKKRNN